MQMNRDTLAMIGERMALAYATHVNGASRGQTGAGMMSKIIGLVVAISVGLVITFNLLPTVFDQWDTLNNDSTIPSELEGIVELIPVFGVLAIALVFLAALMYAIRDSGSNRF